MSPAVGQFRAIARLCGKLEILNPKLETNPGSKNPKFKARRWRGTGDVTLLQYFPPIPPSCGVLGLERAMVGRRAVESKRGEGPVQWLGGRLARLVNALSTTNRRRYRTSSTSTPFRRSWSLKWAQLPWQQSGKCDLTDDNKIVILEVCGNSSTSGRQVGNARWRSSSTRWMLDQGRR